jgi:ABC-2 type transport system permease protein
VNTLSWFLADIALYSSISLMYVLLSSAFGSFGSYSRMELGLYISTYFVINNLFAICFSEAVSEYGQAILRGDFSYYQLTPVGALRSLILLNFNFPAALSTPFLLGANIYFLAALSPSPWQIVLYYLGIVFAVAVMLFLFQAISALLLFGIRSGAVSASVTQLFSIAEKPDTAFHPAVRKVFTFIVPAFLFSAIPAGILLGTSSPLQTAYLLLCPILLFVIFRLLERFGARKYTQSGG